MKKIIAASLTVFFCTVSSGEDLGESNCQDEETKLNYWHGSCENNKREGMWFEFYADGGIARSVNYKEGVLNGVSTMFYKSGRVGKEVTFVAGKLNGAFFIYPNRDYPNLPKKKLPESVYMNFVQDVLEGGMFQFSADENFFFGCSWRFGVNFCESGVIFANSKEKKLHPALSLPNEDINEEDATMLGIPYWLLVNGFSSQAGVIPVF